MKQLKLNIQMFASTNKTTNYELPQFVGTDKPTWLGDFNEAMADIDSAMHENATDISAVEVIAQNASSSASQASQDVATLTGTVNTLSSDVSTVTQTANNAQQTATSALNTANTANGKADTNAGNISQNTTDIETLEDDVDKLKRFTLWTNPAPTASFNGQTVTLSDSLSNYDFYEILYEQTTLSTRTMTTGKIPVGSGTILHWVTASTYYRPTSETVSGSTLTFEDAHEDSTVNNITTIPVKIIGYKK